MSDLNNLDNIENTPAVDDSRKQRVAELKRAMEATIQENGADIVETFGSRANDITVEKVCGYTDKGSIVEVAKSVGKKGEPGYQPHKVAPSAKNVGYVVKNNSATPIEYVGSECVLVDGQYVVNKKNMVLAAGAAAPIRKGDLTALLSNPEFSFRAANGRLRPIGNVGATDDVAKKLEAYTFAFEEGSVLDYQMQIGAKDENGKWYVQDEFKSIFGDEENVKVAAARTRGSKTPKLSSADYEANYIRRLLAEQA